MRTSLTPEYRCWTAMKQRCLNPKNADYPDYGGRGITICDRWMNSFENFLADMGPRPEGMTIERVEVNGGYAPENCVWASYHAQSRNTSRNIKVAFQGKTQCLKDWAAELGMDFYTLRGRLKAGWSVQDAFTKPSATKREAMLAAQALGHHRVAAFGQTKTVAGWSQESGLSRNCLGRRLAKGMGAEQALRMPSRRRPLTSGIKGDQHV